MSTDTTAETALPAWLRANDYPETETDDIQLSAYDDDILEAHGNEYLVLDDDDANQRAHDYIADSLWAFNASFLSDFTGLPEEVFTAMQDKCEDANDTFAQLIEGCGRAAPQQTALEVFVEEAIAADGRGRFISHYDGEEHEISFKNNDTASGYDYFYIYRVN